MKIIADENVHGKVVAGLREQGWQVEWLTRSTPGAEDHDILLRPDMRGYILITNDRDFGELVFHEHLPTPHAILYTRMPHRDWQATTALIRKELDRGVAAGHITTITLNGCRRRPFPSGASHG